MKFTSALSLMYVGAVTAFAPAPVSHQSKSSSVSCIERESIVEEVCVMCEAELQDAVVQLVYIRS